MSTALSDRGHWFRRLQWSTEQDGIRTCRENLQNYQRMLQLVLTPEGRSVKPIASRGFLGKSKVSQDYLECRSGP